MESAYSVCAHYLKNDAMLAEKTLSFNPFPNDSTKPTEFADDNFMLFFLNGGKFVKLVENTVGKGETARHSLQHDPEKKILENSVGNAKSAGWSEDFRLTLRGRISAPIPNPKKYTFFPIQRFFFSQLHTIKKK